MPLINPVDPTATLDQERQTLNDLINGYNNILAPPEVFALQSPVNQDLLVYDSGTGLFINVSAAFLVSAILENQLAISQSKLLPYYWANLRDKY